jgi:addiction module RelE/StbE family toxin
MYKINKSDKFIKNAKKFFKKHPDLLAKFSKIMITLTVNPFEPSLKTHKLSGKLNGLYSCSLDFQYRIILSIVIIDHKVYLIDIGTHDKVYKD